MPTRSRRSSRRDDQDSSQPEKFGSRIPRMDTNRHGSRSRKADDADRLTNEHERLMAVVVAREQRFKRQCLIADLHGSFPAPGGVPPGAFQHDAITPALNNPHANLHPI